MKTFDHVRSLQIDRALRRYERSRGVMRLYWRVVLAWREYQAMG